MIAEHGAAVIERFKPCFERIIRQKSGQRTEEDFD